MASVALFELLQGHIIYRFILCKIYQAFTKYPLNVWPNKVWHFVSPEFCYSSRDAHSKSIFIYSWVEEKIESLRSALNELAEQVNFNNEQVNFNNVEVASCRQKQEELETATVVVADAVKIFKQKTAMEIKILKMKQRKLKAQLETVNLQNRQILQEIEMQKREGEERGRHMQAQTELLMEQLKQLKEQRNSGFQIGSSSINGLGPH